MTAPNPYAALLVGHEPREFQVDALGVATRVWEYGDPTAAETLVLVHGFRGEHHGLEPLAAHLRDLRVISPDLPGFGASPALPDRAHDIDGYAAWLEAFVAALDLARPPVILGHSFGSIVVAAAVSRGLAVSKVILVNPIAAPALSGPNRFMSRVTLGYYRLGRALPPRLGSALLSNWLMVRVMSLILAQSRDPAVRRFTHDQHHTYFSRYASRDSVVEGFEASISADVSQFATAIRQPTLLIGADNDPITTVAAQRRLVELFPDARLELLDRVGHLVHYERPAESAAAVVRFIGAGHVAERGTE